MVNLIELRATNFLKSTARRFLSLLGLRITKLPSKGIVKNAFNRRGCSKKVLISYITMPFYEGISYEHSNLSECYAAAKIFDDCGFEVDVVDYRTESVQNLDKYDVIYGFGEPLEKSFYFDRCELQKRIVYSPGCNPSYSNFVSAVKVKEIYDSRSVILAKSARLAPMTWRLQSLLADKIIVLGNSFVASTYLGEFADRKVANINAFYFNVCNVTEKEKCFNTARKNFLWFGSSGAIHKGLDVLIDIFSSRKDINLHICGLSEKESKFSNTFFQDSDRSQNIFNYGFLDITSTNFREILVRCGAVVFPSLSEGGAVSVLNVVGNGSLIPILSKTTGLDLDDYGFIFSNVSKLEVEKSIDSYLKLSENNWAALAKSAAKFVREEYSYARYIENLRDEIIQEIV